MDNEQRRRADHKALPCSTLNRLIHKIFVRTWGIHFVVWLCKLIIFEGLEAGRKEKDAAHHHPQKAANNYFFYPSKEESDCKIQHFLQLIAEKMAAFFNIEQIDFYRYHLQLRQIMKTCNDKTSSGNNCNIEREEICDKFLILTKNLDCYFHNLNVLIKQIDKEINVHHKNDLSTEDAEMRIKHFTDILVNVLNNVKHLIPLDEYSTLKEDINKSRDNNSPKYWQRCSLNKALGF